MTGSPKIFCVLSSFSLKSTIFQICLFLIFSFARKLKFLPTRAPPTTAQATHLMQSKRSCCIITTHPHVCVWECGMCQDRSVYIVCVCVMCALLPLRFNFVQVRKRSERNGQNAAVIQLCASCLNFLVYFIFFIQDLYFFGLFFYIFFALFRY